MFSYPLSLDADQKDDEGDEHNDTQSHYDEREVGHNSGNQQQLLHSCSRRIINNHTLCIERQQGSHVRESIFYGIFKALWI